MDLITETDEFASVISPNSVLKNIEQNDHRAKNTQLIERDFVKTMKKQSNKAQRRKFPMATHNRTAP